MSVQLPSPDEFRVDWSFGYKYALAGYSKERTIALFPVSDDRGRLVAAQHGFNYGVQVALQLRFGDPPGPGE